MFTLIISHVPRPGQGLFLSYRYSKENSVSTNHVPCNIQEVFTCTVLFIHHNNCEKFHYPHITELGILELEKALNWLEQTFTRGMNSL